MSFGYITSFFFLFFPRKEDLTLLANFLSLGDNSHEVSDPIFYAYEFSHGMVLVTRGQGNYSKRTSTRKCKRIS